jgi:hypothetical protein
VTCPPRLALVGTAVDSTSRCLQIEWKRGDEICADGKMRLIEQGITPSDIGQGQLGDCWLLSALACLAEYPGAIAECLTDAEYSPRGKYGVRLFHPLTGKRQTVRGTLTIL